MTYVTSSATADWGIEPLYEANDVIISVTNPQTSTAHPWEFNNLEVSCIDKTVDAVISGATKWDPAGSRVTITAPTIPTTHTWGTSTTLDIECTISRTTMVEVGLDEAISFTLTYTKARSPVIH